MKTKLNLKPHPSAILVSVALLALCTGLAAGYALGSSQEVNASPSQVLGADPQNIVHLSAPTPQAIFPERQKQVQMPKYILGTSDGFVAVFNSDDTIKEVTGTPTLSLSVNEQQQLNKGINVYTEEQLLRLLQDYDS